MRQLEVWTAYYGRWSSSPPSFAATDIEGRVHEVNVVVDAGDSYSSIVHCRVPHFLRECISPFLAAYLFLVRQRMSAPEPCPFGSTPLSIGARPDLRV